MYINMTNETIHTVTCGILNSYYTLPLCTLWFPDNPIGSACRDKDTVTEVLSQQNDLQSFVLVSNNDALEFFRRGQTWYTRKYRLEDVLDEIEEKVILDRQKADGWIDQDQLKYGINDLEGLMPPLFQSPDDSIEDND